MKNRTMLRAAAATAIAPLSLLLLLALSALAQDKAGDEVKGTKFEVFHDAKLEWRWRYKAANGAIIATPGEGYKAKAGALKAIESLKANVGKDKVEYYEDTKGEHRWRVKASNGSIVAVASEGYKRKEDAARGYELLAKGAKSAKVVEVSDGEKK